MPELSKIRDRDTGVEYDVKDAQARKDIEDLKESGNGNNSGGNVDQCAPFEYQEPSANLFDKSSAISGYYYDIDGTLKALSGYGSSGFVKCSPDTTYTKYLFGGKVTFYNSAKNFIGGENDDTNYITTPDGCNYFRVSFALSNIDKCMILEGRIENPSTLEYVTYNKGYIKSDLLTVLQENLSEDLIAWMVQKFGSPKIRVNPTEPLNITTYAGGNNQPTHPKALYFPNGWNGHKYWMVYTPYPGNNNQQENPCITYSDDGLNWSENGISNPIATAPSGGYNSDTHIVVVDGTMECWWREVVSNEEIIVRKKSTNGINWSEREELFRTGTYTANDCVSPSVIYDEGKYKIWVVYHRDCLKYYESADGTNWQYVRDIAVNPPGSSYKIWHFDIIKTSNGYEFVGCYQLNGSFDKNNFIYYSTSQNNIGYKYPVRILTNGYDGRFDRLELYRPCLLKMNDGTDHEYYNLYYGAQGALKTWAIGLVQASDIESLKCYIEQEALYMDGYLEADTETAEPDVPDIPDEPENPEVMLASISATYSGGDVAVGTAVTALSGIVVTAHYSDGSTGIVTGYTLSGNIAEGSNTITVSYGDKTTTFTVTGIAESGETKEIVINNVVDYSAINKDGFYDAASGEFKTDTLHDSSGFVPVNPGDEIEFNGVSAAYFDADKNYVSGISYSETVPKTVTVPDGVAFICFNYNANLKPYLIILPIKEADIAIGEELATSANIDTTGNYSEDGFNTNDTYGTLKPTNVSPGMVFTISNGDTAAFYSKDMVWVASSNARNSVTVPNQAVYMTVSFNKTKELSVIRTA